MHLKRKRLFNQIKTIPYAFKKSNRRVIIFGIHSADWMTALEPGATVWKHLSQVKKIIFMDHHETLSLYRSKWLKTVVIPLMEPHIARWLTQDKTDFLSLTPTSETLHLLQDKAKFADYINKNNLTHLSPIVYNDIETAHYPLVIKRLDLNSGEGIQVVRSRESARLLVNQAPWLNQPYLLQALIPGSCEYVTHAIYKKGVILWHCTYAYKINADDAMRNPHNVIQIKKVPLSKKHLRQLELFLRPIQYTGPCNIDYKLSKQHDVIVFEINPRLGGSLMRPENTHDLQDALATILEHASI